MESCFCWDHRPWKVVFVGTIDHLPCQLPNLPVDREILRISDPTLQ